jgi:hypothetical protein
MREIRLLGFFVVPILCWGGLFCTETDVEHSGRNGTVFVIYDSKACECVREQGKSILLEIDSLRTADPALDHDFDFRKIDWSKEREAADSILNRCSPPLIPAVFIEDKNGQAFFNFSYEFDVDVLIRILDDLKDFSSV